ncbi:unnamed protein product [Polarella glacialis]|uniref:Uncharacterized protein n=1 Tax=Polarella glacialis TaxID=89957 RepID=A0A813HV32_POLGL|nr:unnamed protein product [Polarella glacialis]
MGRFGPGAKGDPDGDGGPYDPWNNDQVAPLNGIKRCYAIPQVSGAGAHRLWASQGAQEKLPPLPGSAERRRTPAEGSRCTSAASGLMRRSSSAPSVASSRRSRYSVASLRTVVEEAVRQEVEKACVAPATTAAQALEAKMHAGVARRHKTLLASSYQLDYPGCRSAAGAHKS